MNYYDKIPTFEECLALYEKYKAFSHSVQPCNGKDVHSFKYSISYKGMWDDLSDGRINLRGITFVDGKLVSLPFPKFFNIGENIHTRNLDIKNQKMIMEKIDGSLISFFMVNGHLELKTMRSVLSDVANCARKELVNHPKVVELATELINRGYSPMFEYVSPDNRIVLDYGKRDFYFLGARCMFSGTVKLPNEIPHEGVSSPKIFGVDEVDEYVRRDDIEGVVVTMQDGFMFKMKSANYFKIHRILSFMTPKNIVENIIAKNIDDCKGILYMNGFDNDLITIEKVEQWFAYRTKEITDFVNDYVVKNAYKTRKEMAIELFKGDRIIAACVMKALDNQPYIDIINKKLLGMAKEMGIAEF